MFVIWGTRGEFDILGFILGRCSNCDKDVAWTVYQTRRRFTLYFVPTVSFSQRQFAECCECKLTFEIPADRVGELSSQLLSQGELTSLLGEARGSGTSRFQSRRADSPEFQHACLTLGVPLTASREDMKRRYKEEAFAWHPDRFEIGSGLHVRAQEKLKELNHARSVIEKAFEQDDAEQRRREADIRKRQCEEQERKQAASRKAEERRNQEEEASRERQQAELRQQAEREELKRKVAEADLRSRAEKERAAESREVRDAQFFRKSPECNDPPPIAAAQSLAGVGPQTPTRSSDSFLTSVLVAIVVVPLLFILLTTFPHRNATTVSRGDDSVPVTPPNQPSQLQAPLQRPLSDDAHPLPPEKSLIDSGDITLFHRASAFQGGFDAYMRRDFRDAISAFSNAVEMGQHSDLALHNLAWIYATCPDEQFRNGPEAVRLANKLLEGSNPESLHWNHCAMIAAAYAEVDDFEKAIEWQTTARNRAPTSDRPTQSERLRMFQSRQPFRESSPAYTEVR